MAYTYHYLYESCMLVLCK